MGRFICMARNNLGTDRFNGEAAIPHTLITCLTLGNVLVQVATQSSFYFLPPFKKKYTLVIQAKNARAPGPLPGLRTLRSPWTRSREDEETEQQPASFVSGARADTPRPPHRRGPEPAASRPPAPTRAAARTDGPLRSSQRRHPGHRRDGGVGLASREREGRKKNQ